MATVFAPCDEDHTMHDDNRDQAARQSRIARFAFGAMALFAILAGLVLWQFSAAIGLQEDTARLIATVFVIAGVGDVLIVYFWDHLFNKKG
jgi:uncharacterized membrane protein